MIKRLPPSLRPRFPGGDTWSEKIAVIVRHRPSSPRSGDSSYKSDDWKSLPLRVADRKCEPHGPLRQGLLLRKKTRSRRWREALR